MKPLTKGFLLLTGFAVPSALAALFLFGCCVLPFHKYLHRAMPLCHLASEVLTHHHEGDRGGDHSVTPPPPREVHSASSTGVMLVTVRPLVVTAAISRQLQTARTDRRNSIAHGASRCETDVGLGLLLATFRI